MNAPRHTVLDEDPNNEWARVELYRWQHGELPPLNQTGKPFDSALGFEAMAARIERGPGPGEFPTPDNVASVLRYAASRIRSDRELAQRLWWAIADHVECKHIDEARRLREILEGFPKNDGQAGAVKLLVALIETKPLVEGMR